MKKRYISDEEIAKIEHTIYNDLTEDLLESISPTAKKGTKDYAFEAFTQGQEYYLVPGKDYMVLRDGRVYNYNFSRAVKPQWSKKDIICIFQTKQYRLSDMFKDAGWEFNHSKITENYIKNNWGLVIPKLYKQVYNDLKAKHAIY